MKKYLPLFVLFFATSSFAQLTQDWDISPLGQKTYFERDEGYLEMYYNDSTEVFADYRKHYFGEKYYKDGFNGCYEEVRNHIDLYFNDDFYPSLEERHPIEEWYSNDDFFYILNGNDTIKFYHKVPVDFEWDVPIQNASFSVLKIKCKDIVMESVLGEMDSVRIYEMQAYENGLWVNSIFNDREIKLSKKYGWVTFTPFYSWIKGATDWTEGEEFELLGWEKNNVREGLVPNFDLFFESYQVGDIYKWHIQSPVFIPNPVGFNLWNRDSITALNFVSDSILEMTYNSSVVEISRDGVLKDTSYYYFEGKEKSYKTEDSKVFFNTPPGYIFLGVNSLFFNNSIWQVVSIQKTSQEKLIFHTKSLEWFSAASCSFDAVTESNFGKNFISDIGLTYAFRSGVFGDDLTELVGYKRNGITVGSIDLENCAFPTSTNNLLLSNIKIFPNPTSDFLHFDFSNNENKIFKITIYDALGNVLLEKQEELTSSIRISNFPNGFYFVKISSSFGDVIHKFVKEE